MQNSISFSGYGSDTQICSLVMQNKPGGLKSIKNCLNGIRNWKASNFLLTSQGPHVQKRLKINFDLKNDLRSTYKQLFRKPYFDMEVIFSLSKV